MAILLLELRCAYTSRRYIPKFPLCPTSGVLEIVPSLGVTVPLGNPAGRELRTGLLAVRWVFVVYVGVLIEVSMLIGTRVYKVRKGVSVALQL
jgi:hypothetical protein